MGEDPLHSGYEFRLLSADWQFMGAQERFELVESKLAQIILGKEFHHFRDHAVNIEIRWTCPFPCCS